MFLHFVMHLLLKNFSRKLVDSGKVVTPNISNFCKRQNIDLSQPKTSISKIVSERLENTIQSIKTAKETGIGDIKELRKTRNALRNFNNQTLMPFESGAEVVGTLGGGILASNIITPICRNKIAAASLRKQNSQNQQPYQKPIERKPQKDIRSPYQTAYLQKDGFNVVVSLH